MVVDAGGAATRYGSTSPTQRIRQAGFRNDAVETIKNCVIALGDHCVSGERQNGDTRERRVAPEFFHCFFAGESASHFKVHQDYDRTIRAVGDGHRFSA